MKRNASTVLAIAALVAAIVSVGAPAHAGGYPTNKCVAKKMGAAGKFCQSAFKAWSKFAAGSSTASARDEAISSSADTLGLSWDKAEQSAEKQDADCVDATATSTQISADVAALVDAVQATLGAAPTDGDKKCHSQILSAAAKLCSSLLKGNSKFIKDPAKDLTKVALAANDASSGFAFEASYDAASGDCTTSIPTHTSLISGVDGVRDSVVTATTTSPNAPSNFTQVIPGSSVMYAGKELFPRCSRNTPYSFFYKRGTTNKLLMYYQGGGACWNGLSCWTVPVYKIDAGAGDNPDLVGTGFADPDNVLNIFKDWNVVFVSYCTGDVHWGENVKTYIGAGTTRHFGRVNAAVAEKFAREHFLDPEQVFVTGSSAGSYGAIMNSAYLMQYVYPQSQFSVLGDAGIGVITQPWLEQNISAWNVEKNLPTFIPGIELPVSELSMAKVIESLAAAFPNNRFASYQSSYDGGNGGQTSFYHVMKNQNNPLVWTNWWEDQCEWNACMRQFVEHAAANATNYRYYTGAGSRHTIYGSDKLYTDVRGVQPPMTFRDWVEAMINDDVGWVNLDCADGGDCNLVDTCQGGPIAGQACTTNADCQAGISCSALTCVGGGFHDGEACADNADCMESPGGSANGVRCELDPRPNPLAAPYEPGGVVNCPVTACPCGPTGVNCP